MQELRLVAVSEDGSYAILAVPGRSGRFLLPIDDRLRTVAKGQFSRLAQYEIEVENPLRPKEIQERIRAGETAEEIADAAGIPPDKIRRFEGPILAERQYQAEQARRATIPGRGDSGPGPRLGDIVAERLNRVGANAETAEWDSRKRQDGSWQVQLRFTVGSRISTAEWIYDPRKRHVIPDDDEAVRLCLPQEEWAAINFAERQRATATVTPIGSRQHAQNGDAGREGDRWGTPGLPRSRTAGHDTVAADAAAAGAIAEAPAGQGPAAAAAGTDPPEPAAVPAKKGTGGRSRRASVPSWDEIMFGTSRQQD
jgi:Protein of unknown function (DUF3071)